jgi:hypothetical protein
MPSAPGAALAALLEREPVPTADLPELAGRRLDAVRASVKRAGVDVARLSGAEAVRRDDVPGRIEIDIVQREAERPSRVRDVLRKLGVPLGPRGER